MKNNRIEPFQCLFLILSMSKNAVALLKMSIGSTKPLCDTYGNNSIKSVQLMLDMSQFLVILQNKRKEIFRRMIFREQKTGVTSVYGKRRISGVE